jgi:hypothetical protein
MLENFKVRLEVIDSQNNVLGVTMIEAEAFKTNYNISALDTALFQTLKEIHEKAEERKENPHHHTNRLD